MSHFIEQGLFEGQGVAKLGFEPFGSLAAAALFGQVLGQGKVCHFVRLDQGTK